MPRIFFLIAVSLGSKIELLTDFENVAEIDARVIVSALLFANMFCRQKFSISVAAL